MLTGRFGKVLVVEGADEKNFITALIKRMGISDVAGKDRFKNEIPTILKMTRDEEIRISGIIRDAEGNAAGAFDSIKNILEKEGLAPPSEPAAFSAGRPKTGIFVMPGDSDSDMLEDLCLRAPKDPDALSCADLFLDCAMKLNKPPKIPAKTRAQAYLACMPRIVKSVGERALRDYWDLDSAAFDGIRSFLGNFK